MAIYSEVEADDDGILKASDNEATAAAAAFNKQN